MEKKLIMYQQRLIEFESQPTEEMVPVTQPTAKPPPADQRGQKPPPLVRADRQITYDGLSHDEWPDAKLLHDHDTITVDRMIDDIDGPAHRFIIKRGDTVEAYLAPNSFHVGEVIGISHAKEEVRIAWDDTLEKGGWFHVGSIYPVVPAVAEPSSLPPVRRGKLSQPIEKVNEEFGVGFSEAALVPLSKEPSPAKINNRPPIVPGDCAKGETLKSEAPEPLSQPYTFDEFKVFVREHTEAPVTFDRFKAEFQRVWDSQVVLQAEFTSRFNAKQLQILASRFGCWDAKRNSKDKNAAGIVDNMLGFFNLTGVVSYSPTSGETYELAVKKNIEALTSGEYACYFEEKQKESLAKEKALTNPETYFEFRTFLQTKSETDLTDEQLARYDALHVDLTRERRAAEVATTIQQFQSSELQGYEFKIKEGYHDKRQCPVWIVQLGTRVERATFIELNRKAKMLGGWYSSFKKADAGFQFLEAEKANRFTALLSSDADRADVLGARKERREMSAADRLHELATELTRRADETLERSNDSLQNTARRADIQAGVRGRAYADQALARTIHSIAEALSRGDVRYLDGIRHKTHIETLDSVLYLAKWARVRATKKAEGESHYAHGIRADRIEEEPLGPKVVRFAEYPYPRIDRRNLEEIVTRSQGRRGVTKAAEKIAKRLSREKEDFVTLSSELDIDRLTDFLGRAKGAGLPVERFEMECERYHRLQRANIRDIHELRAALREYMDHRAEARGDDPVKVAERELLGKKLPGFFPTPRPVIERMLALADIGPNHLVLEPSCGKGDIIDAIKQEYPDVMLHAIELNRTLSDVLAAKGHAAEFGDFFEHRNTYDRIVMNPPFENGQDIQHVRHALSLVKPGGRLVSVMCEGPFFRSDKKSEEFRDWLETVGADVEALPENSFVGVEVFRETAVRTRLVTINKGGG